MFKEKILKYSFLITLALSGIQCPCVYAEPLANILSTTTKITSNQTAVINQLIPAVSAEQLMLITALETLPLNELQHSLNQMSGEQFTTMALSNEFAGNQFIRNLYNPIRSTVIIPPCPYTCCNEPDFGIWVQGGGGQSFLNNCKHASNTIASGYDVSFGAHGIFDRDWTIGLAGSYAEDHLDYKHDGKGKTQSAFGGIYGLYRPIGYYVFADLAFGGTRSELNRYIAINDLRFVGFSKPKTYQGLGYIEAGMDCNLWNLMVQPFLGLEGNFISSRQIVEQGATPLNLNIAKHNYADIYSRLGAHVSMDQCCYVVSVDLVWKYLINPSHHKIKAQFQSFGSEFRVRDVKQGQSYFEGAIAISTTLCGSLELYSEASGFFGYHSAAYNILGGIKYSW